MMRARAGTSRVTNEPASMNAPVPIRTPLRMDALGRRERMKIRVGNRRVPANDDVIANAHFQFTKQDRVGEIAIVPDLYPAFFTEREMDPVHRAVGTDDQRVRFVVAKAFKREIAGDESVRAESNIGRW